MWIKKERWFRVLTKWSLRTNKRVYRVRLYGKQKGSSTSINLYDLLPPVDNVLSYGTIALVAYEKQEEEFHPINITIEMWDKFYQNLFGGFEDLDATEKEDEEKIDELEFIPQEEKNGYLKDDFVVDDEEYDIQDEESEEMYEDSSDDEEQISGDNNDNDSNLSEEEYDYNSDD